MPLQLLATPSKVVGKPRRPYSPPINFQQQS
jgi:hypothetical protein